MECQVLSGWESGEAISDTIYKAVDTPCEEVLGGMSAFYPDKVQELFPNDPYLFKIKARSYAGVPCFDATSRVIGHISVADNRPIINKDRTMSILKLFAARAGAELERKRDEKIIKNMAYHDALTGLPNRVLLHDRMDIALAHAKRNKKMMGVLYIDFDGFKPINDTLGHAVGDIVLQKIAKRFLGALRREDTVARLGGDEFVVILNDLLSPIDSGRLAQKLLDVAREPIDINGEKISITLSIGISLFPKDGEGTASLLKFADEALYQAKNKGRNRFQYSSPSLADQPA
ncbi:MAG: GGDEF domain-containing protein [Nitrospinae bacterium]|nr:GGDEF domain-containing protein [Nitrospinota bacterium]